MQEQGVRYILIADDDPSIIMFVRTVVEKEGFSALVANNGKEAYKVLSSGKRFDGAIVDLRMPYIEGNELVRFMQSDERLASIPVVIMTGETSPTVTAKFSTSGALGFLPKPFTPAQLRTVLGIFKRT